MRHSDIDIHIDELLLHGFSGEDHYRIREALSIELTRLVAAQGLPPSLERTGEITRLDGGAFEFAKGSNGDAIGARVARQVYEGLRK